MTTPTLPGSSFPELIVENYKRGILPHPECNTGPYVPPAVSDPGTKSAWSLLVDGSSLPDNGTYTAWEHLRFHFNRT